MRRSDREVTDFNEQLEIIKKCDVCRIALYDGEYPYILPLNFGMRSEGSKVELYFHGALEGKKYELIKNNPKASFEMDCGHRLVTDDDKMSCTMEYESVIGQGIMSILSENEKTEALDILMKHYHKEDFKYNKSVVPRTNVFKLTVEKMTAKRRMVKGKQ